MKKIVLYTFAIVGALCVSVLCQNYYVFAQEMPHINEQDVMGMPQEIKTILDMQQNISQRNIDTSMIPETDCFDYYTFQSVQVQMNTDKALYEPNEKITFSGTVVNENPYPVVDGNIFVRISKHNDVYMTDGRDIIDEFFGQEKIALRSQGSIAVDFTWDIPTIITQGTYRADFFYTVGKKFNLGGLPFSNEVVIGSVDFYVNSEHNTQLIFDRSQTTVNDVPYRHIGSWPVLLPKQNVKIVQPLINMHNKAQDLTVTYALYYWDSLNTYDLIDQSLEQITVDAGATYDVVYSIPSLDDTVYYLKITAESGTEKSIVNIRVTSPQEHARLNYPAITDFPLREGNQFTLFSCMHNGSQLTTTGTTSVLLTDSKGDKIGGFTYTGAITGTMMADKVDIIPHKDYEWVKLTATILNDDEIVVDKYEVVYDCHDFDACQESVNTSIFTHATPSHVIIWSIILIVFLVVVIVIGKLYVHHKKNKSSL